MKLQRGDVVLGLFPFSSGLAAKTRPVLVVQDDYYNSRLRNFIVALITSQLAWTNDPCHVLVDLATPDGHASGLLKDSLVSCLNLATLEAPRLQRVIGHLTPALMPRVDEALRIAQALK